MLNLRHGGAPLTQRFLRRGSWVDDLSMSHTIEYINMDGNIFDIDTIYLKVNTAHKTHSPIVTYYINILPALKALYQNLNIVVYGQ